MKKSCTLCGGKLKDGICTECGMDNRKSDEMYQKALNQSDCKNMRLSHVHTDKKAEPYESSVINQARRQEKTQDTGKKSVNKKQNSQRNHLQISIPSTVPRPFVHRNNGKAKRLPGMASLQL